MKFIKSGFDKDTKRSWVVMQHMGKLFKGEARVHPEDMDKVSEIVGGRYAETRATIAALKYERKIVKEKCEECRKFVRACEQYKKFDKDSPTARVIYRQLNRRIKRVNDIADEINSLYKSMGKHIWQRNIILKSIERKSKQVN
jgi:hypothetical protein